MTDSHGMSETVQAVHGSRSDVLLFWFNRARAETSLTYVAFAERLAQAYVEGTPAATRKLALEPPTSSVYEEFADQRDAVVTRCKRYTRDNNPQPIPADLEEAWCAALPAGYAAPCRRALVRRHGFIGAEAPSAAPSAGINSLARVCTDTSAVLTDTGQALADGVLDASDAPLAPAMVRHLDDLIATATAARAQVIEATGYEPAAVAPLHSASSA